VIANIENTRELLLLSDFNGKTRKEDNNKIVDLSGKEWLINICKYNKLTIKNGFFKHR